MGVLSPQKPFCSPLWCVYIYLTDRIFQIFLESQLPHQIVNIRFTVTHRNIKITVLWGSSLPELIKKCTLSNEYAGKYVAMLVLLALWLMHQPWFTKRETVLPLVRRWLYSAFCDILSQRFVAKTGLETRHKDWSRRPAFTTHLVSCP